MLTGGQVLLMVALALLRSCKRTLKRTRTAAAFWETLRGFVAGRVVHVGRGASQYSFEALLEHVGALRALRAESLSRLLAAAVATASSSAHVVPVALWHYPRLSGSSSGLLTRRDMCIMRAWLGADEVAGDDWRVVYASSKHGCARVHVRD